MRSRGSTLGLRTLSLCAGALFALGLGELLLRLVRPEQLARIEYPCFYEPDARLGFRYRPNATGRVSGHFEIENVAVTNSLGWYDDEPLASASPRILAVGDSFTAAMNVPRPRVWTALLEGLLRQSGWPQADVVNAGLDGTGTDVHVAIIEQELAHLSPDVVVLAFYGNDFADVLDGRFARECYQGFVLSYQSERQRDELRARVDAHLAKRWQRFLYDHSFLARLLTLAVEGSRSLYHIQFVQPSAAQLGLDAGVRRSRLPALERALDGLERIARGCGCRLVVAPVPSRKDLAGSLRVFREGAGSRAFEILDATPGIRRLLAERGLGAEALFFVHDAHLSELGNELFARAVFEQLAPLLAPAAATESRSPGRAGRGAREGPS